MKISLLTIPFIIVFLLLGITVPHISEAQNKAGVTTGGNSGPAAGGVTTGGNSGPGTTLGGGNGATIVNPLKVDNLEDLINAILAAVVKLGAIILTLAIIWVGFLFVKAQGNAEEVTAARRALVWTVIGGLILLGAQAISVVISSTVSNI